MQLIMFSTCPSVCVCVHASRGVDFPPNIVGSHSLISSVLTRLPFSPVSHPST